MKSPVLRAVFSLPACLFYCLAVAGLYANSGSRNGVPALAALLANAFVAARIAQWILADARRRRRVLPYDFGSFVLFAWPVVAPVYLFRTRGWRGLVPVGWFVLLYLAAAAVSLVPWFFRLSASTR